MAKDATLPVTIVTGFLGAGKTTLVNRVLADPQGERIAVLVNEFGDVGIDGRLVVRASEELVELANGCVCCSIRGDLVRALQDLLRARDRRWFRRPFDRLLIETSGLASPGPVLQTLRVEPDLARRTREAAVVTVLNAPHAREEAQRHPEVEEQIGYAGLLIVNHQDQADEAELGALERFLRQRNPGAELVRAERSDVPTRLVFAEHGSVRTEELVHASSKAHGHTEGAGAVVLRSDTPRDLHRLKMWLGFLAQDRTHDLWRIKGVLHCSGHAEAVVVQAVYQLLELGPGEGAAPAESVLVLLGRDLDEDTLRRGWEATAAAG